MGMTIDDCIKYFNRSFSLNNDTTDDAMQHDEALETAIDTMQKYQKIEKIVDKWKADTWTDVISYDCMVEISEVME